MGKRKSRKIKPQTKKKLKLETLFDCPFCAHKESVECDIDMKNSIGEAFCKICEAIYSTKVTHLTEPIDIYHEWIDECELANERSA